MSTWGARNRQRFGINIYGKRIVRQVGYLQELNRDGGQQNIKFELLIFLGVQFIKIIIIIIQRSSASYLFFRTLYLRITFALCLQKKMSSCVLTSRWATYFQTRTQTTGYTECRKYFVIFSVYVRTQQKVLQDIIN